MLSDALVSLEATATMTPGNRLLTLSRTEAMHDMDGGMEVWKEGWRDCENFRGGVCAMVSSEKQGKKQQASPSSLLNSSPLSLLASGKLITLLTLLDFLWTVHLALFLGAATATNSLLIYLMTVERQTILSAAHWRR